MDRQVHCCGQQGLCWVRNVSALQSYSQQHRQSHTPRRVQLRGPLLHEPTPQRSLQYHSANTPVKIRIFRYTTKVRYIKSHAHDPTPPPAPRCRRRPVASSQGAGERGRGLASADAATDHGGAAGGCGRDSARAKTDTRTRADPTRRCAMGRERPRAHTTSRAPAGGYRYCF